MADHIKSITDWVKAGGVLLLMGNDSGNAEFEHFNRLAENFGIHFNEDSKNRVTGSQFEMGSIIYRQTILLLKLPGRFILKNFLLYH